MKMKSRGILGALIGFRIPKGRTVSSRTNVEGPHRRNAEHTGSMRLMTAGLRTGCSNDVELRDWFPRRVGHGVMRRFQNEKQRKHGSGNVEQIGSVLDGQEERETKAMKQDIRI